MTPSSRRDETTISPRRRLHMKFRPGMLSFLPALAMALGTIALTTDSARAQWTQLSELVASDGTYYDNFGYAIAVSGDYAVFGAGYADTTGGTDAGAAYVFKFDGANWVQVQKLTASDGLASDYFGSAVAIDGGVIVVGAYRADPSGVDSGAAYVYRLAGNTWVEESKLT